MASPCCAVIGSRNARKFIEIPTVGVCDRIRIGERQPHGEAWIERLGASVIGCLGEDRERKECEAGPGQAHGPRRAQIRNNLQAP